MDTKELLKRVRKLEIKSRGLSSQVFSGEYHSAFKGKGISFDKVREYEPGDDVRTIDWNLTARYDTPFVKVFEEERALNVWLMLDISGSSSSGSIVQSKRNLATEISSVLAFSAVQNNDKIGLVLFSNRVEKYIPAQRGKVHILKIIRALIEHGPESRRTSLTPAINFAGNVIKKRSVLFILSDFMDSGFEQGLKTIAKKHDVIVLKMEDRLDLELPNIGLITTINPETDERMLIDTSDNTVRNGFKEAVLVKNKQLNDLLKSSKIDFVNLKTSEPFIKPLLGLFKKRGLAK